MANAITAPTTLLGQITSFSQLTIVRQVVFMLILASSIALGVSVVLWSRDQDYSVLFADASSQDNADIITVLEQNQVDYQIDPRSGAISVPTSQVQQTRLQLATQGLPRTSSSTGFDALNEGSALGTSNFVEQTRYNRALEQELVTTIKLIRGVRDARVHLSIPKQNSFVRSGNKPSASVMLDLVGTQAISDIQIAGVAHLVSSSVAGMDSENVSIVDQKGNLLSKQLGNEFQASSEQMKFTRELEQEYTQRIMSILGPVVGDGNVRAQVTAELDFTVVETTEENYDPAEVVIRSEQTQEENRVNPGAVLPGELSPNPPLLDDPNAALANADIVAIDQANAAQQTAQQAQTNSQVRLNSTRNYEIDRSVSHRRSVPGSISRLSVAVVVDLQPPPANADGETAAAAIDPALAEEKIVRLTQLVKDTIGYNESRGDSVNVISEIFTAATPLPEEEPMPIWQQSWVASVAKQVGASLVVLLLIFGVLRPAMKTVIKPAAALAGPQHMLSVAGVSNLAAGGTLLPSEHMQENMPEKSEYDQNLQLAQNLVKNEPARAARMIREWVAND
jgi:flagellar M-ring protein FliF